MLALGNLTVEVIVDSNTQYVAVQVTSVGETAWLTAINLLVFYFDQFGAIVSATLQFALLLGVILYRRRYLMPEPGSELPEGGHLDEAAGSDALPDREAAR